MTDLISGLMMLGGGSMMIGSAFQLVRPAGPNAAELAAALPFTPLPAPAPELDELLASID